LPIVMARASSDGFCVPFARSLGRVSSAPDMSSVEPMFAFCRRTEPFARSSRRKSVPPIWRRSANRTSMPGPCNDTPDMLALPLMVALDNRTWP
jgi:hypothetical protein